MQNLLGLPPPDLAAARVTCNKKTCERRAVTVRTATVKRAVMQAWAGSPQRASKINRSIKHNATVSTIRCRRELYGGKILEGNYKRSHTPLVRTLTEPTNSSKQNYCIHFQSSANWCWWTSALDRTRPTQSGKEFRFGAILIFWEWAM